MAYMEKQRATSKEYAAKSAARLKADAGVFKERRKAYLAKHAEYEKDLGDWKYQPLDVK